MIQSYTDLIDASRNQPEPQRLLFVFCRAELPQEATAAEQQRFDRGQGGALTPVICVDKRPEEVTSFERMREESLETGQDWDVVFVAAMSGRGGIAPSPDEASQPLTMMVEAIRLGHLGNYVPFDRRGEPVAITSA